MQKKVKINKELNDKNEEIVRSMEITKTTESYNPDVHQLESIFHYRISEESKIFFGEDGYGKMIWNHQNPINYEDFHKNIVPLDWALGTFGYDMIENEDEWQSRIKKDDGFVGELTERVNYLIPITEEEYNDNTVE